MVLASIQCEYEANTIHIRLDSLRSE